MPYTTTSDERTVGELASRLFGVGERSKAGRLAAKELVALNPELKDIKDLPPGTLVEVPELEDAELKHPLPELTEAAPATLVAGLRAATGALEDALAAEADEAREQANEQLKALRSAELKRGAEERPDGKAELAAATAAAEAYVATVRAAKAEWRKGVADLRKDLDELLVLLADPTVGDR
jgi:hypothetical protein